MNSRFQLHEFSISTSRIHDFNFDLWVVFYSFIFKDGILVVFWCTFTFSIVKTIILTIGISEIIIESVSTGTTMPYKRPRPPPLNVTVIRSCDAKGILPWNHPYRIFVENPRFGLKHIR
jgi:hypothetical protein